MIEKSRTWLIICLVMVAIAVTIYLTIDSKIQHQALENQDYIIKALNDSENQRQQEKIALLNNLTNKIDSVMEKLNVTVTLSDNDTKELREHGEVSGLGAPQII